MFIFVKYIHIYFIFIINTENLWKLKKIIIYFALELNTNLIDMYVYSLTIYMQIIGLKACYQILIISAYLIYKISFSLYWLI